MSVPIARAAVIGAGSMGSGIAAQFANAGIPVVLLDMPAREGPRSAIAAGGVARQLKAGGFMHPAAAALVTPGNTADDWALIGDADWIVEAIIEDLPAKQALFRRIAATRKPGAIVASNTSTIPRAAMVAGLDADCAAHFVITHFFNPPRHMRLVELVAGPAVAPVAAARVREAAEVALGKTVVAARDTPGFIANRIGCFWMAAAAREAIRLGLTVEEADGVMAGWFGVPRTGVFGLFDLVGIDLVPHVWRSLEDALPASDDIHRFRLTSDPVFAALLARGLHGRKAKGGFYRMDAERRRQALDLATLDYRPEQPPALPPQCDLRTLCARGDRFGAYALVVLTALTGYAAAAAPEIADDVAAIDTAMTLGYGWTRGPFALADEAGAGWIAARLGEAGRPVPPLLARAVADGGFRAAEAAPAGATAGALSVAALQRQGAAVLATPGAALWDMGDDVACLALRTKMNVFDTAVLDALEQTIERAPARFAALVIGNDDARAFSAGADLRDLLATIDAGALDRLSAHVARGQALMLKLKYLSIPAVAAPFGLALGAGCEIVLHCAAIVAHAELNAGLPEPKVGLLPAWGGVTQLLARMTTKPGVPRGPAAAAAAAFAVLLPGTVSSSAATARDLGILRESDTITMNRDRLLADAKARARALAAAWRPPAEPVLTASGASGRAALIARARQQQRAGLLSAADMAVAEQIAHVLAGGDGPAGPVGEAALMRLEHAALMALAALPATRARIVHMLATGKPLRT